MPRKKRFEDKETKVVGLRVPKDKVDEIKTIDSLLSEEV